MQQSKSAYCYILASRDHGTLYVGVTSNLIQRIYQHQSGTFEGFSAKYSVHRLVWFEEHPTMESAITREKRIKKWNRAWKIRLIEENNPAWDDLSIGLVGSPQSMDSRLRGNDGDRSMVTGESYA